MALFSKTKIFIDGTPISSFNSLSLHQEIGAHHYLELICRMDVFEDLSGELGEKSKTFLGNKISVEIIDGQDNSGKDKLEFVGVITQIKIVKSEHSTGGEIIILANSPTILADDGPHYNSFIDNSLSDIVKDTIQSGGGHDEINLDVHPHFKDTIHYSVQYNESSFNYINRLAAQYGEWFYYDGTQLIFGMNEVKKEIELNYGIDLTEFNLSLLPQPGKYTYHSNDYLKNKFYQEKIATHGHKNGDFTGVASSAAHHMFGNETDVLFNQSVGSSENQFDKRLDQQVKAIEINQVRFTGISDNPNISLGCIITVKGAGDGKYRVIKVAHSCNEIGSYENHFEAVAAHIDAYPYTNVRAFPTAHDQVGIVAHVDDPDNLGRIKVNLPYLKSPHSGTETPWIRMVSPHVGKESGFYFIPEVGDEVLVGFEGGNAEHPYVLGCLYNDSYKPPAKTNETNAIKILRTRSGLTIQFDDVNQILTIKTPQENTFILDDEDKSISIMDMNNNSVVMNHHGITMKSSGDINLKAKGNIKIKAASNLELEAKADATLEGLNVTHEAEASFTAKGMASAELSASGTTTLKGAFVNIN
jgi:type VI secretion system secreted protein VgrG